MGDLDSDVCPTRLVLGDWRDCNRHSPLDIPWLCTPIKLSALVGGSLRRPPLSTGNVPTIS
jgi:hypothetical protein